MQSCAAVLSQPEHLVVGFKHASWQRMQRLGLGRQDGAAVRVERRDEKVGKEEFFLFFFFVCPTMYTALTESPSIKELSVKHVPKIRQP